MQLQIRLDSDAELVRRHLMQGLDQWVQLGLLSEAQIRELATVLSEPVPERARDSSAEREQPIADLFKWDQQAASDELSQLKAAEQAPKKTGRQASDRTSIARRRQRKPGWAAQAVGSLIEEISVIWLLVLGVFLVVVSSGVLAASQWSSFSVVGQYAILFAYTLAFWVASIWAQQKENLQSTGRMLALTSMLLVPVNFWMIDRFGVLSNPVGIAMGGFAVLTLSVLPIGLSFKLMPRRTNRLNLLLSSWLHLGWGFAIWPVLATYIGTVSTAANLTYQDSRQSATAAGATADATAGATADKQQAKPSKLLSFDMLAVGLSVLMLLVRSLFIQQVPPYQLGLAAGLCGWLLAWITRHKQSRAAWERVGIVLLLLGWGISVDQPFPWQAIGVSFLGLGLAWSRLRQFWSKGYLLAFWAIALQTYSLISSVFPSPIRDRVLAFISVWFSTDTTQLVNWTGVSMFPCLLGTLLLSFYLRKREKPALADTAEVLALAFGVLLSFASLGNSFVTAVNLSLSTATLIWMLTNRKTLPDSILTLTHGVAIAAAASWIYYIAPDLDFTVWAVIALGVAIAELIYHPYLRSTRLRQNTWGAGLTLAGVSYGLLFESPNSYPYWLWLVVPVTLTFVANHRRALYPRTASQLTLLGLLMHLPWIATAPVVWPRVMVSFAVATACAGLNSRVWRDRYAALSTVGFGLLLSNSVVWYLLEPMRNSGGRMMLFWAIQVWALWLIQRQLAKRSNELAAKYVQATRNWAAVLMVAFLLWNSAVSIIGLVEPSFATTSDYDYVGYCLVAVVMLIAALVEFNTFRPMEWRYWTLAWAVELAVELGLRRHELSVGSIGIVTLALAFVVQIAADLWVVKHPEGDYRSSWHNIPLVYGGLGLLFGHLYFEADTGFYTLAIGMLLIGIGRRNQSLRPFSYFGLGALTVGSYELLVYQLSQASGGDMGDGITILAVLALGITMLYRCFGSWLQRYLKVSAEEIRVVNHVHWLGGFVLCAGAPLEGLSQPKGIAIWTVTSLLLSGYALSVGNRRWTRQTVWGTHETWTRIGLVSALLCVAYDRFLWFYDRTFLLTWGGVIACAIGFVLYSLPWEKWGWSEPWRILGLWLPILTLSITTAEVQTTGLLLVAAFYAWMAKHTSRIRLSYWSVLLFDIALVDYLGELGLITTTGLWMIVGLSALYVAEVEPYLNKLSQRQERHLLRLLATGLIGVNALYQTEVSANTLAFAGLCVLLATAFIFAGLIFKVRAFLYVGTATLVAEVVRVLWFVISANSLLVWAVGIVLGLLFIWVAATFESRRSQVSRQLSSWTSALDEWA